MIKLYHRKNEISIDLTGVQNVASIDFYYKGKMYGESQLPNDWILMANKNKVICVNSGDSVPELMINYVGLITIKGGTVIDKDLNKSPIRVVVEDIDYWDNMTVDYDKNTQRWEDLVSTHKKVPLLYTSIVKKDLMAESDEFYFSDGVGYQGEYHQHSDGQAMTGSEHTEDSEPIYRKWDNGDLFDPRKGLSQKIINASKIHYNIPSVREFTKPDFKKIKKVKEIRHREGVTPSKKINIKSTKGY